MVSINERILLLVVIAGVGISAVLTLAGLAAPGWGGIGVFSYNRTAPGALAVISLICLVIALILAVLALVKFGGFPQLPLILVLVMCISGIFLVSCIGSLYDGTKIYSVQLIIASIVFTHISSLLAMLWYTSSSSSAIQVQNS